LLLWIKKCIPTSFVALGKQSEGNALKNGETTAGFSIMKMASTSVGFGQGFLSKEQCDKTAAFPMLSWPAPADFYLFLWMKSAWKGRCFCDAIDISKNMMEDLKGYKKWLPGMFPATLQCTGRSV
jgi:hypothetical protein